MQRVMAATRTKLLELDAVGIVLLVLHGRVAALMAVDAGQGYDVAHAGHPPKTAQ